MRCFPCFDSRKDVKLNPVKDADYKGQSVTTPSSYPLRLPSGPNKPRVRRNLGPGIKNEVNVKDQTGINISAQTFSFRDLAAATKNFRPECFLGEGGFGRVYKGRLESTGQAVAVKQLDKNGLQGNREFLVEVLMLSLLHHSNLVNLTGYCADGDQRLLVYEYMPLGSLEDHLHDLPPDKEPLSWSIRMKIAAGAAKGLEYLHNEANPPVIYRDFKSSNILLDENFHPKLSDFGLAKLGPTGDQSHVSTRVMGTYGYCAPEYAMTGQLTVKSDVYSFGVVLLELITGRRAIDSSLPNGGQNLVAWAWPLINNRRKFNKLADPRLQGRFPMRGLYQALAIASMCIQENAAARPLARDVVTALSFLANQAYDPNAPSQKGSGNNKEGKSSTNGVAKVSRSEEGEGSGRKGEPEVGTEMEDSPKEVMRLLNKDLEVGTEMEDSPKEVMRSLNKDLERERAVAEAKMWGENWREKRRQSDQTSPDVILN